MVAFAYLLALGLGAVGSPQSAHGGQRRLDQIGLDAEMLCHCVGAVPLAVAELGNEMLADLWAVLLSQRHFLGDQVMDCAKPDALVAFLFVGLVPNTPEIGAL